MDGKKEEDKKKETAEEEAKPLQEEPFDPSEFNPDSVLSNPLPSTAFMCPLSANTYGIKFGKFKIRDFDTNTTFLEIEADQEEFEYEYEDDSMRTIRYEFPIDFLKLKTVGTTVEFKVGSKPLKNFRMIEKHFFKNEIIKSFDFTFGFCIPNSTNTWESIYDMPQFSKDKLEEMKNSPWETSSDSYYFVDNKLCMHHRAFYSYQ
jgi:protein unc-119